VITNYGLATLNAVQQRQIERHKRLMLSAFIISIVFLSSYLTRMWLFGDTHFPGTGPIRYFYFFLLISHVGLAVLIAPAVIYTVVLGVRDQRDRHRRIAPKVLPVWIYVLATGVLVYLFLHHWA
jgi:putative membrane protein